jgi:hypothetical protein
VSDHPDSPGWPPGVIEPGGPTDPALGPQPVDDVDRPAAFTLMAPGWYPPEAAITQSYGFCFTPDGLVVLVQTRDDSWKLPGGQLEAGETAGDALVREVAEEACTRVATLEQVQRPGPLDVDHCGRPADGLVGSGGQPLGLIGAEGPTSAMRQGSSTSAVP